MIKRTNAGERRHRIEIRAQVQGADAWKTPTETPAAFASPWAAKLSHSGRKFFQAQQMRSEVTEVFNIRYIPGITTRMRVVEGPADAEISYEILDVDDREGRHAEIDLYCKAVV